MSSSISWILMCCCLVLALVAQQQLLVVGQEASPGMPSTPSRTLDVSRDLALQYSGDLLVVADANTKQFFYFDGVTSAFIKVVDQPAIEDGVADLGPPSGLYYDPSSGESFGLTTTTVFKTDYGTGYIYANQTHSMSNQPAFGLCVIEATDQVFFPYAGGSATNQILRVDRGLKTTPVIHQVIGQIGGIACVKDRLFLTSRADDIIRTVLLDGSTGPIYTTGANTGAGMAYSAHTNRVYYAMTDAGPGKIAAFDPDDYAGTHYDFEIPLAINGRSQIAVHPVPGSVNDFLYVSLPGSRSVVRVEVDPLGNVGAYVIYKHVSMMQPSAITYVPSPAPLIPPPSDISQAVFSGTPNIRITSRAGDPIERETTALFSDFSSSSRVTPISLPSTWLKEQVLVADSSTFAFAYRGFIGDANATLVKLTFVYDPRSTLEILPAIGDSYTLRPGTLKFTLDLANNASVTLFDSDPDAILQWTACFNTNDSVRNYSLEPRIIDEDDARTYVFASDTDVEVRLRVPYVCLTDGEANTVPHELSPPPTRVGGLEVCITWDFPYFMDTLSYDPDLSVVVAGGDDEGDGGDGVSGGDGDDEGWVVAAIVVPIVVGLAVCVVLLFIVAVLLFVAIRNKWFVATSSQGAISIDDYDDL